MSLKTWINKRNTLLRIGIAAIAAPSLIAQTPAPIAITPSGMAKIATVDPRFLSYNVEMVEVTGGRFWKPYNSTAVTLAPSGNQPAGLDPNLFEYRPPIDLSNSRLRNLAAALGPVYVRVSGTWENTTYFQNDDGPALQQPPEGFKSVLTRPEWKAVVGFSRAINAKIVTSVAVSDGARDPAGLWTPAQAKSLFDYTRSLGATIAAAEFMNEPTFAILGGAPKGYDAAAFAKDVRVFDAFLRKQSPKTIFLGPGSVGEGVSLLPSGAAMKLIASEDMLKATGPIFDAFSYHYYGKASKRCGSTLTLDQALTSDWLDRTDTVEAFYASLRDKYLPGKPMWLTETAEAACGGDPLAGQFVDSFRYLNQLGSLAQKGVQVVMHNTLASSDYGLLTSETYLPRPNYWASVLWNRTMGSIVLNPQPNPMSPNDTGLRFYAQCMKGNHTGGVTLLALNTDPHHSAAISLPNDATRYTLSATSLDSDRIALNGTQLDPAADGTLPAMNGQKVAAGTLQLAPASITFLTLPSAANHACM